MSTQYRLVRLNGREHSTKRLALEDMIAIIERGGYWTQNENPPTIPAGTAIVGMGSHGGRGLYLHGVVAGTWEPTGEEPYRFKLPVTWAHVIYDLDGETREIGALVSAFNHRSWSRCTQAEFRAVMDRVLAGRPLPLVEARAA